MPRRRDDHWKQLVELANAARAALTDKPRERRPNIYSSPGSIINAYREGDLSFDDAVRELEEWKRRK